MCHAEELKAELAEDRDKNKQIYELTWKLEKAEARIRDMEVELLTKEKETKVSVMGHKRVDDGLYLETST